MNSASIDVMRLDQTLGQSRCLRIKLYVDENFLEEGIQHHRFAAIFPRTVFDRGWRLQRGGGGRRSAYGHPLLSRLISPASSTMFFM